MQINAIFVGFQISRENFEGEKEKGSAI